MKILWLSRFDLTAIFNRIFGSLIAGAVLVGIAADNCSADIIVGPSSNAVTGAAQPDASQKLRPAIEAFRAGNMEAFKAAYEAALQEFKQLPAIEIYTAKLQVESGQLVEAIAGLDRYLVAAPENPEGYLALGEIALRSQRLTEAALLLEHSKKLCDAGKLTELRKPSVLPGLLALRAEVAERRQLWDAADGFYQELIQLDKDRSEFAWRRGRMLVLKGDIDQGVQLMTQACAVNKELPSPELTAALILAEKQPSEVAEKWFRAAITADRTNPAKWGEYLKWLLSNGRPEVARSVIEKLTPELRKHRAIQLLDGLTARYLGDVAKAEEIFASLHQSNPADLEAADQLAVVLVESKDEAKRGRALQLSEANLRQAPNLENTVATAAWVQFKLGSADVAERMLSELASKTAISPQTAYYVAQVMEAKGNLIDARRVLEAAIKSPGLFAQRAKVKAQLAATEPKK